MNTVFLVRVRDWHLSTQSLMGSNFGLCLDCRVRQSPLYRYTIGIIYTGSKTENKTTRIKNEPVEPNKYLP